MLRTWSNVSLAFAAVLHLAALLATPSVSPRHRTVASHLRATTCCFYWIALACHLRPGSSSLPLILIPSFRQAGRLQYRPAIGRLPQEARSTSAQTPALRITPGSSPAVRLQRQQRKIQVTSHSVPTGRTRSRSR